MAVIDFRQLRMQLAIAATTLITASPVLGAQYWTDVDARARPGTPSNARVVTADFAQLRAVLASAPTARSGKPGVQVYLPLATAGQFALFEATESPVVEPGLAARLPDLRSYSLEGVDDPSASGRLNIDDTGLRGIVIASDGTVYIDPHQRGATDRYVSYTRSQYYADRPVPAFDCGVTSDSTTSPLHRASSAASRIANGDILRSYRLAMAGTTEYTADQGGAAAALANVVDLVMRLNAIFERDLAVHFDLVANNASIIYSGPDPYTNGNPVAMLSENQINLDNPATIGGSGSYDIGHVLGTWPSGGVGVASTPSVCSSAFKARGTSSSSMPAGNVFVTDLLAHEIGHQFDASHTFNGSTSNCAGSSRNAATAWEPASGTTLMSYAGICGDENIQNDHDDYFHVGSIEQMLTWIGTNPTGSSCGTLTATGNIPPVPVAGAGTTIPIGTPFTLAGSATDADGDALTFTWEQFDTGAASPPNTDDGSRPLFRSFPPDTDPTRTFPQISDILTGTQSLGESLPTTDRNLSFRFTARDNRAGGGGIEWDSLQLTSTTSAGPFQVNSFNSGGGIASGATTTIEWDVAGTDLAPVSCASVDIDLSTDSGQNFATALAAGVPNTGSASIALPAITTTQARLRVSCSDNIFFDINDADFGIGATIESTCSTPALFLGESTTASDSLSIALTGEILDVNISIDASMSTFASTAGFSVSHLGTPATLTTSNPNCIGDDIDVVFDDEAAVDIGDVCSGTPAISGSARPVGSLSVFDTAEQAGTWTLTYRNFFFGCGPSPCTGTLNEWCVTTATALAAVVDTDSDGVPDDIDNCTLAANAGQRDTDGDSIGNVCDPDIAVPNDCIVNFLDLTALADAFFSDPQSPNWNPDADFTGTGGAPDLAVNFLDLTRMAEMFFGPPGPGAPGSCNFQLHGSNL